MQTYERKEHWHEQADDQPAELFVYMAGEDRRFSDEDPGDKSPKHRMDSQSMRDQGHCAHYDQDCRYDRNFADKGIVGPPDDREDDPSADGKARKQEQPCPGQALGYG